MFKNFIIKDYYIYFIYLLPFSFIMGQSALSINFFLIFLSFLLLCIFDNLNFRRTLDLDSKLITIFFTIIITIQIIYYGIDGLKYFSYIRFLALIFLLKYFFIKNEITFFFKKYFLILISIFIFIFFDLIFQKITGVDFFGYKSTIETNINRLTGPFGNNEYIPGSYIFHICTPAIVYFIYNISHKNLFLRFFIITSITNFYLLSIFITGERTSFLLATLSLIILIFIKKNFRKELVFALVTSFFLILFFSANNSYYKDRYLIFKDTVIGKEIDNSKKNNFLDSQWGAHYLTALEIFKKNILFGSGARSYRIECHKEEYNKINSRSKDIRCSTHPHNFYLELLAETGIISFVVFLIYLLNSIVSSFKILFYKKELTIFISFFVIFLSIIWPIRATGSILSNFAGSMIWLNFAFLSAINFRVNRTNI